MGLHLEKLDYQERAIQSVVKVFSGQERNEINDLNGLDDIHSNRMSLTAETIRSNIEKVILDNGADPSDCYLTEDRELSIEMETGTGKTLVYIRTAYELHKEYNFSKFIILVPSIAIKEGVLKTAKIFREQLRNIYGFSPEVFEYTSKKLSKVRHFVQDSNFQVMVMTIQSFSSDDRIINQTGRDDSFYGLSYLDAISHTQPIVLMDEPQEGMDTPNNIERIGSLNPLFKVRYSATHKVVKNLLFRLTPFEAYQQNLVKKIEVLSVAEKNDEATLKLELIDSKFESGKQPKVKINYWKTRGNNIEWKNSPWLTQGKNLYEASGNISYKDFTIERIYRSIKDRKTRVSFTNGTEIVEKEKASDFTGIFRAQLEWLLRRHFQKKQLLAKQGIKCLSLIFIDKVSNYTSENGIIKALFAQEFSKVYSEIYGEGKVSQEIIEASQGYYFAKVSSGEYTDNQSSMARNKQIYDLILKDKEALLDMNNPVEFIFSHSALGVGWDNPNIFNIATLNQSYSDTKKRQEIGRGLRICVNQEGKRVYDESGVEEGEELNLLTIIPNETYETFASQYQEQIKDHYGDASSGSKLRKRHKGKVHGKNKVSLNKKLFESKSFKEFWKKMAVRSNYSLSIDEKSIVDKGVDLLSNIQIPVYQADISLNRINRISEKDIEHEHLGTDSSELVASFNPIDIVQEISDQTNISIQSILEILGNLQNYEELTKNPPLFIHKAVGKLRDLVLDEMLRTIEYNISDELIELDKFKLEFETFLDVQNTSSKGIYDQVPFESSFEKSFAIKAESDPQIVCFLKLPDFYNVSTPLGPYNPDFGIVLKKKDLKGGQEDEYNFIVEVKSTNDLQDRKSLTPAEVYKIKCAVKHFEALGLEAKTDYTLYHAPVKDYVDDFKNKL